MSLAVFGACLVQVVLLFLGFKCFLKAGTSPSAGGEWGSNSIWAPLFKLPISDQLAQAPGKSFSHPELLRMLSSSSHHFLITIQPEPWMFSYCIRFYQPKRFHEASFTLIEWAFLEPLELWWALVATTQKLSQTTIHFLKLQLSQIHNVEREILPKEKVW